MAIADGLVDDRERACVLHMRSIFESIGGHTEAAASIAREAEEAARAQRDKDLQKDVPEHLAGNGERR